MLAEFLIATVSVFILTVIMLRIMIPILKSHKVGQKILEIGPRWHASKEGTPTMGGITFIPAILAVLLCFAVYYLIGGRTDELVPLALTLCLAVLNAIVGFVDDYCKLIKKQNEGLLAYQKYLLQLVMAGIYIVVMSVTGNINTVLHIPFSDIHIELGIFYYVLAIIIITGIVNSVNLSDGVDGLASSMVFVVGCFFTVVAFKLSNTSLSLASAAIIGGTLGFLVYNFHPARIFMGDTGSLFWGGMLSGMAFMIDEPLIILIAGIVFVFEAISVIIQVSYFKITHGKRFFKMAPIHHHFEKCGWSENKVVAVFSGVTLLGCIIAWLAYFA